MPSPIENLEYGITEFPSGHYTCGVATTCWKELNTSPLCWERESWKLAAGFLRCWPMHLFPLLILAASFARDGLTISQLHVESCESSSKSLNEGVAGTLEHQIPRTSS